MRTVALVYLSALLLGSPVIAKSEPPSARNANAIVKAISSGADLDATGLAQLLYDDELKALGELAGCSASLSETITNNLAVYDWACDGADAGSGRTAVGQTLTLRFRDDGSLFAIAINPSRPTFAPTAHGAALSTWPSRRKTAERFATAVSTGGDPSLAGLIPLTPLQHSQLARLADSQWRLQSYMSEADKAQARKALGPATKFAEAPKDGIEMIFASRNPTGPKDQFATLYFDDDDRAVGFSMEDSLIASVTIRERR